jgi:formate hydrogenlyase subunit 6/NADH:ubiquinone oxidoreductase subunit I
LFFLSSSSSSSVREKKSFTTTTKNCGFCGFLEEVCGVVHLRHKQILKPPRACEELAAKMGKSKASLSVCSGFLLVHSYESKQAQEEHADDDDDDDDENHDVLCFFFCVLD